MIKQRLVVARQQQGLRHIPQGRKMPVVVSYVTVLIAHQNAITGGLQRRPEFCYQALQLVLGAPLLA